MREYKTPAIFTKRNGSEVTVRTISWEIDCAAYRLDMTMNGDDMGIQPYLDVIQKNIDTVVEVLG